MPHSPQFEDWFVERGEPVNTYELPPGSAEENQAKAAAITPELCERFNIEITGPPPV
ncbi:hypothetical protein [Salinigranum marinum]|uniref:hypothetical protein n=1 Tax=Salinigranum marinum TaxID=1515595 RepID=UPI002989B283|nr:hypothetical protein [Salinigranum marinum]